MKVLDRVAPHAHWFLRIALASVFLYHGIGKFPHLSQFAAMIKMPFIVGLLVALAETGGALLILLGGFFWDWVTRLGALIQMPVMVGAIAIVHWPQWKAAPSPSHPAGGMEFPVTLLLIQLYLFFKGNNVKTGRATLDLGRET
jgi:putative oxidoreductase